MNSSILLVSTNRADQSLLTPLVQLFSDSELSCIFHTAQLIPSTSDIHSQPYFNTLNNHIIRFSASSSEISITIEGLQAITSEISLLFSSINPSLVIVLGDRYELLPIIQVSILRGVSIAHLSGGEITLGAIDNVVRDMVSVASALHFVAHEHAKIRLQTLLPSAANNIYSVGDPGLDHIRLSPELSIDEISNILQFEIASPFIIATLHPETTTSTDIFIEKVRVFSKILEQISSTCQILLSHGNSDFIGFDLNDYLFNELHRNPRILIKKSFGPRLYLNLLSHAHIVLGNSSSGLVEAPFVKTWTINLGDRQKGRLLADSVYCFDFELDPVVSCIYDLLSRPKPNSCSPFGDGYTCSKVYAIIKKHYQGLCD